MKLIESIFRLFLIILVTILTKVFLQISFGTILQVPRKPINALELFNGKEITFSYLIYYLMYEFFYIFLFYIWIYIILYFIIAKLGNKISIHLFYWLLIYNLAVLIFNREKVDFSSILIVIILGIMNWWMFKKYVKLQLK